MGQFPAVGECFHNETELIDIAKVYVSVDQVIERPSYGMSTYVCASCIHMPTDMLCANRHALEEKASKQLF